MIKAGPGTELAVFLAELPVPAAIFDEQDRVQWANRSFEQLCGGLPSVLGRPLRELPLQHLAETLLAEHKSVRALGTTLLRERTVDSPWRAYHFPLSTGSELVGTILFDLSNHVEAVREARLWRSRLLDLLMSLPLPIATCTPSGQIVEANPSMAAFFGTKMGSLRGVQLTELLRPVDPSVLPKIERTMRSGGRATHRFRVEPLSRHSTSRGGSMTLQPVPHPELDGVMLLASMAAEDAPAKDRPVESSTTLTDREARVLEHVALGRSSSSIGRELGLSVDGVNYHIARLRRRLGSANRTAMVAAAYTRGLLRPDRWPPAAT